MVKGYIKNRKGQKMVVLVEETENPKGLAFVMHGLSGNKEQPHILAMIDAFKSEGYNVVSFDTTNTFGESEGQLEDATLTNYYEDLEDVIGWAKSQSWYEEPFVLAGHSLGEISVFLYAEKYPEKVKALAPISMVVSGKLSLETKADREGLEDWKEKGIKIWTGHSGQEKRLKWNHMEDRLKYDVFPEVDKIKVPVLMIVGENDDTTPPEHQKLVYDKLQGEKEFHIIKGSEHTFRSDEELKELKQLFVDWIRKLN